jgi:hypothetical protein
MDILAHALWTNLAARGLNRRLPKEKQMRPWIAAVWGDIPDFLAFTPVFLWLGYQFAFGDMKVSDFPASRHPTPEMFGSQEIFAFTQNLYSFSHSAVVFAIVLGLALFLRKIWKFDGRIPWEMGGWLLHILIDVPTHSYKFFPTPVFWPISSWRFDGISWGIPWFMALNYGALVVLYVYSYRERLFRRTAP